MRAADLVEDVPMVYRGTTGAEATRIVAEYRLTGLVVADDDGQPFAVIPGSQLLEIIVPQFVRDDPTLAHAYDESSADDICQQLNSSTIGDLLESNTLKGLELPSVGPEDTLLEIATVMVRGHYPLILCHDRDGRFVGTIMLSRVMAQIARRAGQDSALVERRLTRDIAQRGQPWSPPEQDQDS